MSVKLKQCETLNETMKPFLQLEISMTHRALLSLLKIQLDGPAHCWAFCWGQLCEAPDESQVNHAAVLK